MSYTKLTQIIQFKWLLKIILIKVCVYMILLSIYSMENIKSHYTSTILFIGVNFNLIYLDLHASYCI